MEGVLAVNDHLFIADQEFDADPEKLASSKERSASDILRCAMFMPTALGFFGAFRVQSRGENAGCFNIRTHGIDPLALSVQALAVSKGISTPGLPACIARLGRERIISVDMENALTEAHNYLVEFLARDNGSEESVEWVDPVILGQPDRVKMRRAMKTIEHFQKWLYEDEFGLRRMPVPG